MKCPLCNKNLGDALKVLGITPREMVRYHGQVHLTKAHEDLFRAAGVFVNDTDENFTPHHKEYLKNIIDTIKLTTKLLKQWEESI